VAGQAVGGTVARTLHLSVEDGRLRILHGPTIEEL